MRKILLVLFISIISACSTTKTTLLTPALIKKDVDFSKFNKGFEVKLKITNNTFATKSQSGAVSRKLTEINAYRAFLTTNNTNIFKSGSNPMGDGIDQLIISNTANPTITFSNVPSGGPYYACIAAFSDVSGTTNITKIDPSITSIDQQWGISINNVTIDSSGNKTFSTAINQLQADLYLDVYKPAIITTSINVIDGTANPTIPIQATP